jgi:hypothetical protein
MSTQTEKSGDGAGIRRIVTQVSSLSEVVGAHPEALRKIYQTGRPADPAELGSAPRGRILAIDPMEPAYMLTRPLVELLARDWMPWKGKEFELGGNEGANILLGRRVARFRTEIAPSDIDGQLTLSLSYADPAFKNPWPVSAIRDELRTIASGVAIGPAFFESRGRRVPWLWFGLERVPGSEG